MTAARLSLLQISPKVVLLVFVSGKIVITGAKDRGQLSQAIEDIFPTLEEYKKL